MQGDALGPYRVGRVLGAGGMGVVREATDVVSGRRVALKLIAPDLAEDPDFRCRFVREARALAALDSAHVVQVLDHGDVAGRLFLATELLPDGDLAQLLHEHGPPPLEVAVDVVAQVAAGLQDAHAAGLVHRDVKPANVFLRRRGGSLVACLGDFGVAREVGAQRTRTGTAGTPAFMAPELHTGAAASVASDVYSLGCLLWTALTGRPPYTAATEYQLMSAHLGQPVPQLPGADDGLGSAVNRVLRTAMAKRPEDRYPSAASFRDDLLRLQRLPDPDIPGPDVSLQQAPLGRPGRRRAALVAAAVVVATGSGLGLASLGGDEAAPTSTGARPLRDPGPATSSLARALEQEGALTRRQSRCVAERWIAAAGLSTMVRAGLFDADLDWVERHRGALTPELERTATAAAARCAGR